MRSCEVCKTTYHPFVWFLESTREERTRENLDYESIERKRIDEQFRKSLYNPSY